MVPGTHYGQVSPPKLSDIFLEDATRVLFSLRIVPPACATCLHQQQVALDAPSELDLAIENLRAPAPAPDAGLKSSIGFAKAKDYPDAGYTDVPDGYQLTGTMKIGLTNVVFESTDGGATLLGADDANAYIVIQGDGVAVEYRKR